MAWKPPSLRALILLLLGGLVLITIGGGIASIWYIYSMERFFTSVFDSELPGMRAALELKNELVAQKGYVTYYVQDGDPQWLEQLAQHQRSFETMLRGARQFADTERTREILRDIDAQYVRYDVAREEVIKLYKAGNREEGLGLHKQTRERMFNLMNLVRQFLAIHEENTSHIREENRRWAKTVKESAVAALVAVMIFGLILAYILIRQVLGPIRELAVATHGSPPEGTIRNEITALGTRVSDLMRDVEQTRSKLEWSREHLLQAEKWALVGKLAAGVAHNVRNPLASVKMRLFTLERSLILTADQRDDFEVISEEISHIDTIVNNFLEFSRPPKLKMRKASPSDAVDMAVKLLKHRLESSNVSVLVKREEPLPEIRLDPEQMKEVMVNLMVNACEAMVTGGKITIEEETGMSENNSPVVVIRVSDTGPGISEGVQLKVFQPFFSTKEEGTGLGLSIATRIVEEHGGWFDIKASEGEGATFVITLPTREEGSWAES